MSFLNYRLAEASPRSDWLSAGLPFGGNTTIAAVIDAASDNSLRDGFSPFSSLHDYVRGGTTTTTLLCSPDEFAEFLRRNLSFSNATISKCYADARAATFAAHARQVVLAVKGRAAPTRI